MAVFQQHRERTQTTWSYWLLVCGSTVILGLLRERLQLLLQRRDPDGYPALFDVAAFHQWQHYIYIYMVSMHHRFNTKLAIITALSNCMCDVGVVRCTSGSGHGLVIVKPQKKMFHEIFASGQSVTILVCQNFSPYGMSTLLSQCLTCSWFPPSPPPSIKFKGRPWCTYSVHEGVRAMLQIVQ